MPWTKKGWKTLIYCMFFLSSSDSWQLKIYYIPWPPKKIAAQISYQVGLPKTAKICAARTANWPKLPKNELQKNIWYVVENSLIRHLWMLKSPIFIVMPFPRFWKMNKINSFLPTYSTFWPKSYLFALFKTLISLKPFHTLVSNKFCIITKRWL